MSLYRPNDESAYAIYREARDIPWWRFWLTEREKREARDLHRALMRWLMIEREANR